MVSQDRRVRRTQHLLAKALIELTLERGYEAISIRDITERADIGYATFFRHYRDKDELLKDVLDVVLAELLDLLSSPLIQNNTAMVGTLLFRYVQEQSAVVRVLLGSHNLRQHLITIATQSTMTNNIAHSDSPIPFEIAAHHTVASTIALIEWWLAHQMPYPPEKMGLIYKELIADPTTTSFSPRPSA